MNKKDIYGLLLPGGAAEAVLISDELNMRYLSGFRGGEGLVFVSPKRQILITDSRYTEQAANESEFEIIEEKREHTRSDILKELVREENISSLAYEDLSMRCSELEGFKEALTGITSWVPLKSAANDLRRIKTPEELELLRKAFRISQEAFSDLLGIIRPGMTEKEARAELEYRMMKKGASGLAFATIIASGTNSSMPHAIPSDRAFENGDFVTFDFGCHYEGYCSDMTRTIALGEVSEEQKEVYETVLKAQKEAILMLKAGVKCSDADRTARKIISDAGYGQYFGHGLGHSLGLFIHEKPALSPSDDSILQENILVTVEPGIYLPGKFGVRIEDTVIIAKDGCEDLVYLPKELTIL